LLVELEWLCVAGQVAGWRRLLTGFFGAVRWGVDLKWRGALGFGMGRVSEVGWGCLPTRT
jgi:hypothetical protein